MAEVFPYRHMSHKKRTAGVKFDYRFDMLPHYVTGMSTHYKQKSAIMHRAKSFDRAKITRQECIYFLFSFASCPSIARLWLPPLREASQKVHDTGRSLAAGATHRFAGPCLLRLIAARVRHLPVHSASSLHSQSLHSGADRTAVFPQTNSCCKRGGIFT